MEETTNICHRQSQCTYPHGDHATSRYLTPCQHSLAWWAQPTHHLHRRFTMLSPPRAPRSPRHERCIDPSMCQPSQSTPQAQTSQTPSTRSPRQTHAGEAPALVGSSGRRRRPARGAETVEVAVATGAGHRREGVSGVGETGREGGAGGGWLGLVGGGMFATNTNICMTVGCGSYN